LPSPTSPLLLPSTIANSGYFDNNDDENLINMIVDRLNSISPPKRKSLFKQKLQELVLETFSTRSTIALSLPRATLMTPHCTIADGKEGISICKLTRKFLNLK
jgi:hypothetical protein